MTKFFIVLAFIFASFTAQAQRTVQMDAVVTAAWVAHITPARQADDTKMFFPTNKIEDGGDRRFFRVNRAFCAERSKVTRVFRARIAHHSAAQKATEMKVFAAEWKARAVAYLTINAAAPAYTTSKMSWRQAVTLFDVTHETSKSQVRDAAWRTFYATNDKMAR